MPPFVPFNVTSGGQIDPEKLNELLQLIAAAFNTHETGDFPADSVPITAVVADQSQAPTYLGKQGTIAAGAVIGTQQIDITVPFDCTLLGGFCVARALSATPNALVESNIYHEDDATYLWAANVTLNEDAVPKNAGTPAKTDLTAGDVLTLRVVTPGAETVSDIVWTLLVKSTHQS
jgi:hypothetical protein